MLLEFTLLLGKQLYWHRTRVIFAIPRLLSLVLSQREFCRCHRFLYFDTGIHILKHIFLLQEAGTVHILRIVNSVGAEQDQVNRFAASWLSKRHLPMQWRCAAVATFRVLDLSLAAIRVPAFFLKLVMQPSLAFKWLCTCCVNVRRSDGISAQLIGLKYDIGQAALTIKRVCAGMLKDRNLLDEDIRLGMMKFFCCVLETISLQPFRFFLGETGIFRK